MGLEMGIENIRLLKEKAALPKPVKTYEIPKVSKKTAARLRAESAAEGDHNMDAFFESQRSRMTGTCQCGCGEKSQKHDDLYFSFCICHIFPKRIFKSIARHPLNWVERTFWGGHHTNMDDRSIELWVNYADFDDIAAKFHRLVPLLTDEERATKFYHNLERLVVQSQQQEEAI